MPDAPGFAKRVHLPRIRRAAPSAGAHPLLQPLQVLLHSHSKYRVLDHFFLAQRIVGQALQALQIVFISARWLSGAAAPRTIRGRDDPKNPLWALMAMPLSFSPRPRRASGVSVRSMFER
jgi:hypothetical protein